LRLSTHCTVAAFPLDSVLFDATAGDAIRPAGLRYGITGSVPSASTDPLQAMLSDLKTLTAAVAGVGGPIYFVVSATAPSP
jgi:hypothetical protein